MFGYGERFGWLCESIRRALKAVAEFLKVCGFKLRIVVRVDRRGTNIEVRQHVFLVRKVGEPAAILVLVPIWRVLSIDLYLPVNHGLADERTSSAERTAERDTREFSGQPPRRAGSAEAPG